MGYTYEDVFDRSLFTTLHYRMGVEEFDAMSCELIKRSGNKNTKQKDKTIKGLKQSNNNTAKSQSQDDRQVGKGKLLLDATVADYMIAYPTDLGLIARGREESERIIAILCEALALKVKPCTYRKQSYSQYLNVAKKKN